MMMYKTEMNFEEDSIIRQEPFELFISHAGLIEFVKF